VRVDSKNSSAWFIVLMSVFVDFAHEGVIVVPVRFCMNSVGMVLCVA
jgi:hypothetical protein